MTYPDHHDLSMHDVPDRDSRRPYGTPSSEGEVEHG
jgi:hypothetical protein